MAERWWISNSDTSFTNTANWAEANGTGVGGFSVPTSGDNVWLNGSGLANCHFDGFTSFDDLHFYSSYTGTLYDDGNDVWIYGGIYLSNSSRRIISSGRWKQKNTAVQTCTSTNNHIYSWTVESGVSLPNTGGYFNVKELIVESHATVSDSSLRIIILYPTEQQPLKLHPDGQVNSLRIYVNVVDIQQSGWNGNLGKLYIGYGADHGNALIAQSDMICTSYVEIHAGNGAKTEAEARVLDMNGYNLTCSYLAMGTDTTSYDGYAGKVKLGSGTHTIGYFTCDYKNTYCYIDWGTSTVNMTNSPNMRGLIYSTGSGTLNLIGTGDQSIIGSGYISAHINVDKPSGRVLIGEPGVNFKSMDVMRGYFDFDSHFIGVSGDFRVLESGKLWGASGPDQDGGTLYCRGNVDLRGTEGDPLYINNLNFAFDSPSVGRTSYAYVNNSSYSGDSYMDATHPTNIGYEGTVSGWRFCDLYYPIETPAGRFYTRRIYSDP